MTIKEAIALTFAYFHPGQSLADAVLLMYAEDLSDLNEQDVVSAYHAYRRNPKNTRSPLPAQIREMINPQDYISAEEQAAEIAARVVGAVSSCGWNNGRAAENFIGPVGWSVVQRQGGWSYICENLGTKINPSTFQAQVRKQLEVSLKYGEDNVAKAIAAPAKRGGELSPVGDVLKLLNQKSEGAK